MIKVDNLQKSFANKVVLNRISFSVGKGITGFLGPNGAGKTTTMKIICGAMVPDAGQVQVLNEDVTLQNIQLKNKIGYLAEDNPLYKDLYLKEYLTLVGGLHQLDNVKERVNEVIHQVGLKSEENKKINELSKGFKQRVGLAQAIIHNPEILILDEPTSGLDPNQLQEIRKLIKDFGKNKIVLLSTHILQEVEQLCDHVILINHGNIVADERLQSLLFKFNGSLENAFSELTANKSETINL